MDILTGPEIKTTLPLFDSYDRNQAVIYSVLEGQFEGCIYTDDAQVWGEFEGDVYIVPGSPHNKKITFPEDLEMLVKNKNNGENRPGP